MLQAEKLNVQKLTNDRKVHWKEKERGREGR